MRKPVAVALLVAAVLLGLLILVNVRPGKPFKSSSAAKRAVELKTDQTTNPKPPDRAALAVDESPFVEVVDEKYEPIEDAIACTDLESPALGRTQADGKLIWGDGDLPFDHDGLLDFLVHAPPIYGPATVRLSRSTPRTRVILKRGLEIVVDVVDSEQRPIANAQVRLLRRSTKDPDLVYTLAKHVTDRDGKASFRGLTSGLTFVTAEAAGFGTQVDETVISPAKSDTFRITLFPTNHEIRVLVLGPDAAPVAGATVELRSLGRRVGDSDALSFATYCSHVFSRSLKTNRDGRAVFAVVRGGMSSPVGAGAGAFDVRVTLGSLEVERWQMQFAESDATDVTVDLPKSASLTLNIDRRGSSAPLDVIFASPFMALNRGTWRAPELTLAPNVSQFTLEVPASEAGLSFLISQHGRTVCSQILTEFLPGEKREIAVSLLPSHRLSIFVKGRSGQPVPGRLVVALQGPCPCHGKEPGYCGSRMYGNIRVPASGEAQVDVEAGGYFVRFVGGERTLALEPVTVVGDTTLNLVVDDLVTVRGRVEDLQGRPVQGVTVAWFDAGRRWNHLSVSGSDGEFRIQGVPEAPGVLFVLGPNGGAVREYEGPVPKQDLRIRYSTLRLRGVIRGGMNSVVQLRIYESDPSSVSVWGYSMYLPQQSVRADANGVFEADLMPGKWELRGPVSEQGPWHRAIDVTTASGEMQVSVP